MSNTEITIKGFKAFESRISLRPHKINLIIGPNSSGKSSLIHFFQLLSNSLNGAESTPLLFTPIDPLRKDLISFRNIIFAHDEKKSLDFSYSTTIHKMPRKGVEIPFDFKFDWKITQALDGSSKIKELMLHYKGERDKKFKKIFTFVPTNKINADNPRLQDRSQFRCSFIDLKNLDDSIFTEEIFPGIEMLSTMARDGNKTKKKSQAGTGTIDLADCEKIIKENFVFLFKGLVIDEIAFSSDTVSERPIRFGIPLGIAFQFLVVFQNSFKSYVQQAEFIGPIREQIKPAYPMATDTSGNSVGYVGHNLGRFLGSPQKVLHLNKLISKIGIPYQVRVEKNDDIQMNILCFENCAGVKLRADSLGAGISQVLPVILALANLTSGNLFIEQPELHLHPRLHEQLAALIIDESLLNDESSSIFIESHSESLIKGILHYSKKVGFPSNDIAIFCINSINGSATIDKIEIDKTYNIDGQIDWSLFPISGFFGEL